MTKSSVKFVPVGWTTDRREVGAGDKKGQVETKWGPMEQYLNREMIWLKGTPEEFRLGNPEFEARMMGLNFLEFHQLCECQFRPATDKGTADPSEEAGRFIIYPRQDETQLHVACPKPDLPTLMRDPRHPDHERYCEFRVKTLKPFENEMAVEDYYIQHGGSWSDAYTTFREYTHAHSEVYPIDSRVGRIVHADDQSSSEEADPQKDNPSDHLEGLDFEPGQSPHTDDPRLEAYLANRLSPTPMPPEHWTDVRAKYTPEQLEHLTHDWVSKSADEGTLLPQDAPPPCDPASLNSEQRCVFEKLMAHRRAQIVSETSGTPPPSPLRLTVYGLGGTGKSHVLNCFKQAIDAEADRANAVAPPGSARAARSDRLVKVMAPSASAAVGVGGSTIHATQGLSLPTTDRHGDLKSEVVEYKSGSEGLKKLQQKNRGAEYYFFDECGMIGAQTLALINSRMNQAHVGQSKDTTFGDKSVILFGHFAQLPPINDPTIYNSPYGKKQLSTHQANGRNLYGSALNHEVVILRKQMRQRIGIATTKKEREERAYALRYQSILHNFMEGEITGSDWMWLHEHSKRLKLQGGFTNLPDGVRVTNLCTSNPKVLANNHQRLKEHASASGHPIVVIPAVNSGEESHMKFCQAKDARGLEPELALAIGAPVMCTWNGWVDAGIMNGALGTVYDIIYAEGEGPPSIPEAVLVQYPDAKFESYLPDVPGVVKFTPIVEQIEADKRAKPPQPAWTRRQFPLRLAYTVTIHKSQGMTLQRVSADLGDRETTVGLTYVAASRVREPDHFMLDPMPPLKRLQSYGKSPGMQYRKTEERALEKKFYDTAAADADSARAALLAHGDGDAREAAIARLVSGDEPCFVPTGWLVDTSRWHAPRAIQSERHANFRWQRGGGVVPLPLALGRFVSRYREQRSAVVTEARAELEKRAGETDLVKAPWHVAPRLWRELQLSSGHFGVTDGEVARMEKQRDKALKIERRDQRTLKGYRIQDALDKQAKSISDQLEAAAKAAVSEAGKSAAAAKREAEKKAAVAAAAEAAAKAAKKEAEENWRQRQEENNVLHHDYMTRAARLWEFPLPPSYAPRPSDARLLDYQQPPGTIVDLDWSMKLVDYLWTDQDGYGFATNWHPLLLDKWNTLVSSGETQHRATTTSTRRTTSTHDSPTSFNTGRVHTPTWWRIYY